MVVNFWWSGVNWLLSELSIAIEVSRHNMDRVQQLGARHPKILADPKLPDAIEQAEKQVKEIQQDSDRYFAALKCDHINSAANKIGRWKGNPKGDADWAELNTRSRALRDAILTELQHYFFYQYPKDKGEKLKPWKQDWQKTIAAFPDTTIEVFSAVDCYALGHNTASVFHSMRIAEHGLRAIAKERRVKLPREKQVEWGTWQEIIKALDDEIKLIGGTKKAGAAKDAALEFYSGARADLNGFKDEYRNQVSHVRARYDDLQALRALNNVNTFMERLAAKIDHNNRRIRWGLK